MKKLLTVILVGFAPMVAAPGSAQANPANCDPITDPSAVYSPCYQSYIQGMEWEGQGLEDLAQIRQRATTDQALAICRQGLQSASDRAAFAQGCADVMVKAGMKPPG